MPVAGLMELSATRDIPCSADQVFTFLADASKNPLWQKGMRHCWWVPPEPIGIGSVYEQEASFLGRSVRSRFEVVACQPGRTITIKTIESTFPITVTRSVQDLGPDRCRVEARIVGEPGRIFAIAGPLLRRFAQRSVDADYDRRGPFPRLGVRRER